MPLRPIGAGIVVADARLRKPGERGAERRVIGRHSPSRAQTAIRPHATGAAGTLENPRIAARNARRLDGIGAPKHGSLPRRAGDRDRHREWAWADECDARPKDVECAT